jgi:hypothetical protein
VSHAGRSGRLAEMAHQTTGPSRRSGQMHRDQDTFVIAFSKNESLLLAASNLTCALAPPDAEPQSVDAAPVDATPVDQEPADAAPPVDVEPLGADPADA